MEHSKPLLILMTSSLYNHYLVMTHIQISHSVLLVSTPRVVVIVMGDMLLAYIVKVSLLSIVVKTSA